MNLNLKKPCSNCPFLREGAIELEPGRLDGIIEDLTENDHINFQCHKTVHSKQGGEWLEDENGEQVYEPSGNESMCIGSAIYMLKIGRPSICMRIAIMTKMVSLKELQAQNDKIINPPSELIKHG